MKIDNRFQNLPLEIGLHRVFNATKKTLHPAAIILDDNGQVSVQIKEYLKARHQFTLLQLGITCTVANLLEHLILLFTRKKIRYPSVQELRFFTQAVKNRSTGHYFVIERSHYIPLEFLSLFLGLIIDLDRHAQFIFIFTRENFERIQQSSYVKDKRFIFFSKHVKWFAIWKEEKFCKEYESTQSVFREEATHWKDRFVDSEFKTNPGVILLKKLSGTFQEDQFPSTNLVGLTCRKIINIIEDNTRVNYVTASRLGSVLKTSTQYWLDIQSRYEAKRFLRTYAIKGDFIFCTLNKYIKIIDQRSEHFQLNQGCCHPGEILVKKFLEPSGLASQDWRNLLMLSTPSFMAVTQGRNEMSFQLIMTLCKIFKTQAHFWMDIQNSFYAAMGDQQLLKKPL